MCINQAIREDSLQLRRLHPSKNQCTADISWTQKQKSHYYHYKWAFGMQELERVENLEHIAGLSSSNSGGSEEKVLIWSGHTAPLTYITAGWSSAGRRPAFCSPTCMLSSLTASGFKIGKHSESLISHSVFYRGELFCTNHQAFLQ